MTLARCSTCSLAALVLACSASGPSGAPCDPGPLDAIWVTEGDPVAVQLACTAADAPDDAIIELTPLPAGADYDPTTGAFAWTPGLDQAAVYDLTVTAPDGASTTLRIGVADRFDDPANVPVTDPEAYPLEFGLPVVFITPAPTADAYEPVEVFYRGEYLTGAEAKLRGRSSLDYPKNSYTLKFPDNYRFSDPDRDFIGKRRIVLTTPFDDTSYIRNRLAFDMWNALGPAVPVQSYTAVVYLDGDYAGLYTLGDHIDDELLEQQLGPLGLSGDGDLYKAIDHDANFRLVGYEGDPKQTLHDGYEKKSGDPEDGQPGAYDDLHELVAFIATATDQEFAAQLGDLIDVDEYLRWWTWITVLGADDNAGKNTYHYHPPGGKWLVAQWDPTASFGQIYTTDRRDPGSIDDYAWASELFIRLADTEPFATRLRAAVRAALDGPLAPAVIDDLVAGYRAELVGPALDRDQALWGEAFRAFPLWSHRTDIAPPAAEIDYVRAWLTDRRAALDAVY